MPNFPDFYASGFEGSKLLATQDDRLTLWHPVLGI